MTSTSYLELSYWQVAIAASLIALNGALSLWLRLGLERSLLVAAVRMSFQLLLVGFVLHWVFAVGEWYVVLAMASLMTLVAGFAAVNRTKARFKGVWLSSLVSVWSSSWLVTGLTLLVIVRVEPWYRPQYALPLLGMVLGNTLSGISLGLDRFSSELESRRDEIESLLALGATRWEAALGAIREAIRTGMIPTINSMLVTGLVSLPGMMTGQLLSGVDPIQAVKYQLVIMFVIAAGTALGTVGIVVLSYGYRFSSHHQLIRFENPK
jgi:putative ABC transport system permease protein